MSNETFRIYEPVVKLPSVIEVEGIYIKKGYTPTSISPDEENKEGIIYSDNAHLIYIGTNGSITFISNQ
jgi:hypothetical protein